MDASKGFSITVAPDGPYLVSGRLPLAKQHIVVNADGESIEWREGNAYPVADTYALCRCGQSGTKPFCDGTHARIGFDGTETANRRSYREQAKRFGGPEMVLDDVGSLCAFARFCDPLGQVWTLVGRTDREDVRQIVAHEAGHCPSGRLVVSDRATGVALEPKYEPSIGLIEDTAQAVSGPLWVRGGVPVVSSAGSPYEIRNRVTLCRCGASLNKPFCDGSHASVGFRDDA